MAEDVSHIVSAWNTISTDAGGTLAELTDEHPDSGDADPDGQDGFAQGFSLRHSLRLEASENGA